MIFLTSLFTVATLGGTPMRRLPVDYLVTNSEPLDKAWDLGVLDATNNRNDLPFITQSTRVIGTVDVPGTSEHLVSSTVQLTPNLLAYVEGFESKKESWSASRISAAKLALAQQQSDQKQVVFSVLMVAISTPTGIPPVRSIPEGLKGLNTSLTIGGKPYSPAITPGGLSRQSQDPTLIQRLTASPPSSLNFYTVEHRPTFDIYRASLRLSFDLYNPNGTARAPISGSGTGGKVMEDKEKQTKDMSNNLAITAEKAAAKNDAYIRS